MSGGLWTGGMQFGPVNSGQGNAMHRETLENRTDIRDLQNQIDRLCLLNQALWELLQERLNVTDAALEAKAQEVDLRDGKADGKISEVAVRCPTCQRVCNSKHDKCIYCGTLFQKPMFG